MKLSCDRTILSLFLCTGVLAISIGICFALIGSGPVNAAGNEKSDEPVPTLQPDPNQGAVMVSIPIQIMESTPILIRATWSHDGKTTGGDVVDNWGGWEMIFFGDDGKVVNRQLVRDPEGTSREWQLDPIALEFNTDYVAQLRAYNTDGAFSEPDRVDLRIEDVTLPPTKSKALTVFVTCPEGIECRVIINGEAQ